MNYNVHTILDCYVVSVIFVVVVVVSKFTFETSFIIISNINGLAEGVYTSTKFMRSNSISCGLTTLANNKYIDIPYSWQS